MKITTFISVEKIRIFVVTEFVKLSDEFDTDYCVARFRISKTTKLHLVGNGRWSAI